MSHDNYLGAGIDLGSHRAAIACLDQTGSFLTTGMDQQGHRVFPCEVAWDLEEHLLVAGYDAHRLGEQGKEVVRPVSDLGSNSFYNLGPRVVNPTEATAVILRNLRERMEDSLPGPNQHVDRAVITVRSNLGASHQAAMREAARMAGWQDVELIPASLASVAYSCWINQISRGTFLVHDLDEEGLTCSVVRYMNGRLDCPGSEFFPSLGSSRMIRLLAEHLLHEGRWTISENRVIPEKLAESMPGGRVRLMAKLRSLASRMLRESARQTNLEVRTPLFLHLPESEDLCLEAKISRAYLEDCFQEWIAEGVNGWSILLDRWGIPPGEPEHLLLTGSIGGFPLLRDTLSSHMQKLRGHQPFRLLTDDPDRGRAFGAAIQAHSFGTRLICKRSSPPIELRLRPASPGIDDRVKLEGEVRGGDYPGGSIQIRAGGIGLIEEAFLDENGSFSHEVELAQDSLHDLEWTVCDGFGMEQTRFTSRVHRWKEGEHPGNPSDNVLLRSLSLQLLGANGRPASSELFPAGTPLPVTLVRTFRITDTHGRIVLPILEEDREIHRFQWMNPNPVPPRGTRVRVEITLVSAGDAVLFVTLPDREPIVERIRIPPGEMRERPNQQDLDDLERKLVHLSVSLPGSSADRLRHRFQQARRSFEESLFEMDDGPMIKSWATIQQILHDAEKLSGQTLEPNWKDFKTLARDCLNRAGKLADRTGQDRQELFHHVHAQERYAERAREEFEPERYRECWDNLKKFAHYLDHFLNHGQSAASSPALSPEEQSRKELEGFRERLATTWKAVRLAGRQDLEHRLNQLANEAKGLHARLRSDPGSVMRDVQRFRAEIEEIATKMTKQDLVATSDLMGLLEAEPGEC